MIVSFSGNEIVVELEHLENALGAIDSTSSGISIDNKSMHLLKAYFPIDLTFLGMLKEVKFEHEERA